MEIGELILLHAPAIVADWLAILRAPVRQGKIHLADAISAVSAPMTLEIALWCFVGNAGKWVIFQSDAQLEGR
jgi:hypothetical protein